MSKIPNGVFMKLCNFLALDLTYQGKGLERGGKLEQKIWNEFSDRRQELGKLTKSCILTITVTYSKGIKRRGEADNS